ncbi:MAG: Crp/Fnr family transcriptional regulator [Proteobacteria bacterium]|nr:Crp/Fnr family transcriptional regulator [Pseudomonadota bacterium]
MRPGATAYNDVLDRDGTGPSLHAALHLTLTDMPLGREPNFLDMLSADELQTLTRQGRETRYAPGEFFFRQGDPHYGIHFIKAGKVRSYYNAANGREITLAYWPRGHFVGAPQILGGGEHMWSSIAVEPSVGLWLPGEKLKEMIYRTPDLAIAVIEGLVHKSKCYTALLQIIGTQSKTSRLCQLLLTLAQVNKEQPNIARLGQHFTQKELATMVGATRQAISTSLDKLEKKNLIRRVDDDIFILDIHGLRHLCD